MDPFDLERGKLATYKVDGKQIFKTVDGTNWRVLFTYGDAPRLQQIAALLNESAKYSDDPNAQKSADEMTKKLDEAKTNAGKNQ